MPAKMFLNQTCTRFKSWIWCFAKAGREWVSARPPRRSPPPLRFSPSDECQEIGKLEGCAPPSSSNAYLIGFSRINYDIFISLTNKDVQRGQSRKPIDLVFFS